MSNDLKCQSCKYFQPHPGQIGRIGKCLFPLPEWLNKYVFWSGSGNERMIERGYVECATYEATP